MFSRLSSIVGLDAARLKIFGHHFQLDGTRVFLSGINQAWVSYGYDFGNDQYSQRKAAYEETLDKVQAAGGNSVRKLLYYVCSLYYLNGQHGNDYLLYDM